MDFSREVANLLEQEEPQKGLRLLVRKAETDEEKETILKALLENSRHQGDVLFVDDHLPKNSTLAALIPDALAEYDKQDPYTLHQD